MQGSDMAETERDHFPWAVGRARDLLVARKFLFFFVSLGKNAPLLLDWLFFIVFCLIGFFCFVFPRKLSVSISVSYILFVFKYK